MEEKILLSSHDMDLIYELCDYVYVLGKGRILDQGLPEEVFLKKDLLKRASLERPWLVKLYQELGLPLCKNERQLFQWRGENYEKRYYSG